MLGEKCLRKWFTEASRLSHLKYLPRNVKEKDEASHFLQQEEYFRALNLAQLKASSLLMGKILVGKKQPKVSVCAWANASYLNTILELLHLLQAFIDQLWLN